MDGTKPKNRRFIIISTVLFILLITTIITNVFLIDKTNGLIQKNNKQINLNVNNNKELEKQNNKLNELQNDINFYQNIDTEIENVKKELFKNVKSLEDKILTNTSSKKIAYLTFDDGPYYLTNKILDTLDNYNVKATFFTIGRGKEHCYDNSSYNCTTMYSKIASKGHTIANHTYSHLIWGGIYKSSTNFINDVIKQENLIKEKTGIITNIVRFPGGSSTAGSLKNDIIKKLRERNYGWVDWSAQDGDGGELTSSTQAMNYFKNSINSNIEVVLLHDYSTITYQILPNMIEYLENKGYILLPLFYESNMINK